jgi:hypothetical protein
MGNVATVKLDGLTLTLKRNGDGSFTGIRRGKVFTVRKVLDPHRPRTATRWSGPQARWSGECEFLGSMPVCNSVRQVFVQRVVDEIDKKIAGVDRVFGAGVNGPWRREDISKLADEVEISE